MLRILLLLMPGLLFVGHAEATAKKPEVVRSEPANGASNVPLDLGKVKIHFNRNMKMNTWTLQKAGNLPFPPLAKTTDFWKDPKTFVMEIKPLREGVTYGIQLNGKKRKGFMTADTQEALPITILKFTAGSELEQSIPDFETKAEGTVLQVCKPIDQFKTKPAAPGKTTSKAYLFKRVNEPREMVFSLLIPDAWITEGGMLRLDPTAQGGAANSIDAKLDFSVKKDPKGTVMIRWLPELLYKDMRGSPARALGQFPDGSNYMGMTVWPLLSACDFIQQGVFLQAHPNARNVRFLEKRDLPEVAEKYRRAMAATLPGANFTYTAGAVLAAYEENGVAYKELLYTAVENWGAMGAGAWKNRSTFYLRTPIDQYDSYSKVFAVIQNSVVLNMNWVVGEIKGQIKRGKIAHMTYEEIQRIGREIVHHQQTTNAQIQKQSGLAIRGQEEYVNPHTGEKEVGSNLWRNRWMDNNGNTIFSDNDDFDPNTDPRLDLSGFKRAQGG